MLKILKILGLIDMGLILLIAIMLLTRDRSTGYSGWIIAWPLILSVIDTCLLGTMGLIYFVLRPASRVK